MKRELRLFSDTELAAAVAQIAGAFEEEAHKARLPTDATLRQSAETFADLVMERSSSRWSGCIPRLPVEPEHPCSGQ
jgi:hypothetical protein